VIDLLIKLLPYIAPALRYADNPNRSYWRLDLLVFTLIVWVLDMIIAHLFFSPQRNEWTISHVLEREAAVFPEAMRLAQAINAISPRHIKAVI